MVQTIETPTEEAIQELKTKIKKLNSKAGQIKMDLHDIAEGLPADLEQLPATSQKAYDIYQELTKLKQQLKTWEAQVK
ncbi:MAG: CCE_0567 family metalloprotein [Microcoleaceae cyanobacterium]